MVEMQDASQAFALVQKLKPFVDLLERHVVGDIFVDLQIALHITIDELWDLGFSCNDRQAHVTIDERM